MKSPRHIFTTVSRQIVGAGFRRQPIFVGFAQFPKKGSGFLKNAVPCLGSLAESRNFTGFCKNTRKGEMLSSCIYFRLVSVSYHDYAVNIGGKRFQEENYERYIAKI